MAPPRKAPARGGIALGVLGMMLLAFFSVIFLLGKHGHHNHVQIGVHPAEQHAAGGASTTQTTQQPGADSDKRTIPATTTKPAGSVGGTTKEAPGSESPQPTTQKPAEQKPAAERKAGDGTTVVAAAGSGSAGAAAGSGQGGLKAGLSDLDLRYRPTKEMVQKIAQEGYLVVTWANWHYQDFVRTWLYHVKKVGISGYIVGAMDEHLLQVLVDQKTNVFSMRSGLTLGDFGWGSKTFAKMGREKIKLIRLFLNLGVNVVISDVDVLWLRNPIPYFEQYPNADVLTSSDHLSNTVPGYELEKFPDAGSAANIGIMMFRKKSMDMVNLWIDVIEKDANVWDQNAFNDIYRVGARPLPDNKQHLFMAYHDNLTMGILPVSAFCSGHTFFTQRMWKKLNLEPYALHATFQFSGTPGKRHRMREYQLFDDPPEYYDHPGGFLSFQMDGLEELLKTAGPADNSYKLSNVQGHFKLVNHQIQRIRNAFAIGTILGRAIVIPQLWCGLDRWWAPHTGTIPGSSFELPFPCPLDHVLDLETGMTQVLPAETYGPQIIYKESSLFNNSKFPEASRSSKVVVELCPAGDKECSDGSSPAPVKGGKVRVQSGLLSEQLRVALRDVASFKILEFSTMKDSFKNFTSPGDWSKFYNRVKLTGSIWCCVQAHPGHIHYDPWWDLPGHVDKFNRAWDEWKPTCGP